MTTWRGFDRVCAVASAQIWPTIGSSVGVVVQHPRGLLMTVATNLARDMFRRGGVRADYVARSPQANPSPGADHTAEDDLQLCAAILSLPPKLRDVLLLNKIGGLTNREIAHRYRAEEIEAWRLSRDPRGSPAPPLRRPDTNPAPRWATGEAAGEPSPWSTPASGSPDADLLGKGSVGRERQRGEDAEHARAIAQQMRFDL